ncbi:hypothetical protein [Alkalicoccobacillus murimartini]|uniref:DUF5668 domain-containing protein n=1 Tax=Alkalicoccobacillus murimartini TaxID=171685 RepID=A0ABT9YHC2_9BACI|nr:hypothetical protein [Alkalicoccobacillus murimartini]MDQ0207262.1 hypothetical protein [Alkalicoccobacillus murimartini]
MKKEDVPFSIIASLFTILFLFFINWMTTPEQLWAIYPALFLLFWPLNALFKFPNGHKWYSLCASILLICILLAINLVETPGYLWILYAWLPILYWPLVVFAGRLAAMPTFSVLASIFFLLYYVGLNIYFEPGFPWFIFPAFVILWWPMSVTFAKRPMLYSVFGALLVTLFFWNVNTLITPDVIWAVYPIFTVLWWPLTIYYFVYRRAV